MSDKAAARAAVRALVQQHLSAGNPLTWFEPVYATAAGNATAIPWADLAPNPHLVAWLDRHPLSGGAALVVGCGLGDDAEELSSRGLNVTAFDISPTAIDWCTRRFPGSHVRYVHADLLSPPAEWSDAFDFVFEAYTLQSLPGPLRGPAVRSLARFLRPEASLLVVCRGRDQGQAELLPPWPLTRDELDLQTAEARLATHRFEDFEDAEDPPVRRFRVLYRRA